MAHDVYAYFGRDVITHDFLQALLGDRLGGGKFREVYAWKPDPTLVVKFETSHEDFSNPTEWKVWTSSPPWLKKWLAPCERISPYGTVLWQRRCDEIAEDKIPRRVPQVLQDVHANNWGLYEGRPVMVDYGFLSNVMWSVPRSMKTLHKGADSRLQTKKAK